MLTPFTNGKYENSCIFVQDLPLVLTPVNFLTLFFILYLNNSSTGMKILYESVARE